MKARTRFEIVLGALAALFLIGYLSASTTLDQSSDTRAGAAPAGIARQTLTPSWAGDDGFISHRDVTALGPMDEAEAWGRREGADGVIHLVLVPLGTCDDLIDCAAHAADACGDLGYGKATSATLGPANNGTDETVCNYTCENGTMGTVSCAG